MFDTKVMTAPNSPRAAAKAVMPPAMIPGSMSGRVIVTNRSRAPAPRLRAASSRPRSTVSSEIRMARTMSGKAMTAVASAAPLRVNTSSMPRVSLSHAPITPWVPKTSNSR
jgi:hypothetical protein